MTPPMGTYTCHTHILQTLRKRFESYVVIYRAAGQQVEVQVRIPVPVDMLVLGCLHGHIGRTRAFVM